MTDQELLEQTKRWLRISTDVVDDEVAQTIAAAILDLQNVGVQKTDRDDPLIRQAIKLYCKSQFGYDTDAERFSGAYEHLKMALAMSRDYNGGGDSGSTGSG